MAFAIKMTIALVVLILVLRRTCQAPFAGHRLERVIWPSRVVVMTQSITVTRVLTNFLCARIFWCDLPIKGVNHLRIHCCKYFVQGIPCKSIKAILMRIDISSCHWEDVLPRRVRISITKDGRRRNPSTKEYIFLLTTSSISLCGEGDVRFFKVNSI